MRYLSAAEVASDRAVRWGILTNGCVWRLYYQGARSRSEEFFEIDLGHLLGVPGVQNDLFSDLDREHGLKLFYCLFHRAAFHPQPWDNDQRTFHQVALAEARLYEEKVSKTLGERVFATVFPDLANALAKGDPEARVPPTRAYLDEVRDAALILLYRLLFVLYAEDRHLLPVRDARYHHYSLRKLREDIRDKRDKNAAFSTTAPRIWMTLQACSVRSGRVIPLSVCRRTTAGCSTMPRRRCSLARAFQMPSSRRSLTNFRAAATACCARGSTIAISP